jgi:hypothetical protein
MRLWNCKINSVIHSDRMCIEQRLAGGAHSSVSSEPEGSSDILCFAQILSFIDVQVSVCELKLAC